MSISRQGKCLFLSRIKVLNTNRLFPDLQTTNGHIGSPDFYRVQVIGQKGTAVDDGHRPASPHNPLEFDDGRGRRGLVGVWVVIVNGRSAGDRLCRSHLDVPELIDRKSSV